VEIDQIRYFLAICDKRNFTRAAQTPRRQKAATRPREPSRTKRGVTAFSQTQ
jgi:DNA-binding transcriptional LysR family regulator